MLHAVGCDKQLSIYPYVPTLYPSSVLEAELEYLARHFTVVPLQRIAEGHRTGKLGRSREIALTFDDGLRNNITSGYPILRRLGLPATFFVCPGLIETGRWQWAYESASRLIQLSQEKRVDVCRRLGSPTNEVPGVMRWMTSLDTPTRMGIGERLREATPDFAPTRDQCHIFDTMTWQDLRSLDPALITVGSHSMNHPILSNTDPKQLITEIVESRRVLEKKLLRPIDYFCYPDGAFNDVAVDLVRQHYRAAVSTRPGFVLPTDDIYSLPRIGAGDEPLHDLAWRLHRPTS